MIVKTRKSKSSSLVFSHKRLKVFFAAPHGPKWRKTVEIILGQLKQSPEFEVHHWLTSPAHISLDEGVKREFFGCDALVAVVTSGESWPAIETAIYLAGEHKVSKHLYLLVERSLENPMYSDFAQNVYYFDRGRVENLSAQLHLILRDLLKLLDNFIVLRARKNIRILKDGFGIITYRHKLLVPNRPDSRVRSLSGRLAITNDVAKRARRGLPLLKEMAIRPVSHDREAAFEYRILSHPPDELTIVDLLERSEDPDSLSRSFSLMLNRSLVPGEMVEWVWGFTFPCLFKSKGQDTSTYNAVNGAESTEIALSFELERSPSARLEFEEAPAITITDFLGREKGPGIGAFMQRSLCFANYVWRDLPPLAAGDKIVASWVRH